jgi:hypothetical protein
MFNSSSSTPPQCNFRDGVGLPKKSPTWGLAEIDKTEERAVLSELDPTAGSQAKFSTAGAFGEWPAWVSFWFSGCLRALAKCTAWAGFIA